jgi:SAM-dependent methyltransferase
MSAKNATLRARPNEFCPSPRGILTNPFYIARHGLHRELARLLPSCSGRLLDLGCGTKPYRHLATQTTEYIGLEVDTPEARRRGGADLYYDGRTLPFANQSFDTVFCSQVLEHVFEPQAFLGEIHRVLSPGGRLLLTVPFVWDEHEQPFDYARYSSFGLKHLLQAAGFVIQEHTKTWCNAAVFGQLHAAYLYKCTRPFPRALRGAIQLLFIAPCTLIGLAAARILPHNPDLYLDNIIMAQKTPTP